VHEVQGDGRDESSVERAGPSLRGVVPARPIALALEHPAGRRKVGASRTFRIGESSEVLVQQTASARTADSDASRTADSRFSRPDEQTGDVWNGSPAPRGSVVNQSYQPSGGNGRAGRIRPLRQRLRTASTGHAWSSPSECARCLFRFSDPCSGRRGAGSGQSSSPDNDTPCRDASCRLGVVSRGIAVLERPAPLLRRSFSRCRVAAGR
jgi:hypothetical protein